MIEKELQVLLANSAALIRDFVESESAPPAKFDKPPVRNGSTYFTNLRIDKDEMPWVDEVAWESDLPAAEVSEDGGDED